MSYPYSKAAKRRAKANMPALAKVPKRETKARGRARMEQISQESQQEAQSTVLEARARQMGKPAKEARNMNTERLSEGAGQAIDIICEPEDAKRLWSHWTALTGAEDRYHRSIGMSINAKTAKLEMTPETFETRSDDRPDLRTEEERDRDAERAWDTWKSHLAKLPTHSSMAIIIAMRDWATLAEGGQITPAGRRFVDAMERLDRVIAS